MNKGKSKKTHLIVDTKTKCGKQGNNVEYYIDINLVTCKICLKNGIK